MCEVGQITPHSGADITNSAHQKAPQPQKTRVFAHKTVGTAFATALEHNLLWELHKMKKTLLAVALASSLTSFGAVAADKAPEPDFSISGNFGITSDYRFRGVSQTDKAPAAQGGFDFVHKGGAYFGTWASNVSQWANPSGSMEIDFYGGYKTSLGPISLDLGAIAYVYPNNKAASGAVKNGTEEIYVGVSYGPVSYKASVTTGTWFGIPNSKGVYHDLGASFPLGEKVTLSVHAGLQDIKDTADNYDFKDFKVGLSYDVGNGYSVSVAAVSMDVDTDAGKSWYTSTTTGHTDKKLYSSGGYITLTKTF